MIDSMRQFDPSVYLEKRFFGEVFLHLTKRKARPNVKAEVQEHKRTIRKQLGAYKEATGITEFDMANPKQTAQFEAARIYTAYVDNIQTRFGHYLRPVVTALLKTRERKRDLEEAMKGRTTDEVKKKRIKTEFGNLGWIITVGDKNIRDILEPVLTAYDNDHKLFNEQSRVLRTRNGFGLYGTIQTDGMSVSVIKKTAKAKAKSSWKARKRDTEANAAIEASGTGPDAPVESAATDSLPENQPKKPKKREKPGEKKPGEFTYIHQLSPEQLANMKPPIFMDPARQDIVFGMTDESTSEEKALFRYTRSQKAKETWTTRYRKLREKVKNEHPDSNEIKAAEARLAAFLCTSILPDKYEQYVRTHAAV
ncbi:hypothetical protein EV178_001150 [Coemansia sp. RSA 1646]|nr:hypothetical protein EV178_001150 [Coemansia sp. RSA 1646]